MTVHSAGILAYRFREQGLEVLLAHPGGPFWSNKDRGAWSIPKGEFEPSTEEAPNAALREFAEETGLPIAGELVPLGTVKQRNGKVVHGFAVEADVDPASARSNTFEMEWPPRSGRAAEFPEIDRIEWFPADEGRERVLPAQAEFISRLQESLEHD